MRIGTLRFEGPMRLVLRTMVYKREIEDLFNEMATFAYRLMSDEIDSWADEYMEKHGNIDAGYADFVHPKRGEICERVSNLYENNKYGLYVYNNEDNIICFAYLDGEMKDRGMTEANYRAVYVD